VAVAGLPRQTTKGASEGDLRLRRHGRQQVEARLLQGHERRGRCLGDACKYKEGRLLWLPGIWADGEDGGRRCGSGRDGMPRVMQALRGWDLAGIVDQARWGTGAGAASRRGCPFGHPSASCSDDPEAL
jgi:hypothetical protein